MNDSELRGEEVAVNENCECNVDRHVLLSKWNISYLKKKKNSVPLMYLFDSVDCGKFERETVYQSFVYITK